MGDNQFWCPKCKTLYEEQCKCKINELPIPNWAIIYEDNEVKPEMFTNQKAAIKRLDIARMNWSCHLFKRID